jgi:hypothetical protein
LTPPDDVLEVEAGESPVVVESEELLPQPAAKRAAAAMNAVYRAMLVVTIVCSLKEVLQVMSD